MNGPMNLILALKSYRPLLDVIAIAAVKQAKRFYSRHIFEMASNCIPDRIDLKSAGGERPFTIFVEGNIGSGKTTFLNHFSKYDALILSEPVESWRNVCGHNMLVSILKCIYKVISLIIAMY